MEPAWKFAMMVCAASAITLAGCTERILSSESTPPGTAELSATSLDFGLADCGGEAPPRKTLLLTNDGDGPLTWRATLESEAHFELNGQASGTLDRRASTVIAIEPKPLPTDLPAGTVVKTTLVITTDDPTATQIHVPLTATTKGATLQLVAPSVADFGQVPVGVDAPPIGVVLRNVGNAPARVEIQSPGDGQFSFSWSEDDEGVEVAPGETFDNLEAHFTPTGTLPAQSTATIAVTGAVCGASASTIDLRGEGLAGVVGISPGTLDFGKVDCGTQADPKTVTIFNAGNELFSWNAALESGADFSISKNGGAVAPGASVQVTITPGPLGMTTNLAENGFGDVLAITTNVRGEELRELVVKQTAYGAILSYATDPMDFGDQPLFVASDAKPLTVTNDGNAEVEVEIGGGAFMYADPPSGKVAASGGTLETAIAFKTDNFGLKVEEVEVSTNGPLCQPLPDPISATGVGGKAAAEAISVGGQGRRTRGGSAEEQGGCAIVKDSGGRVACWGANNYGQLGTSESTNGPHMIPNLEKIVSISSGGDFNCAVDEGGSVWCWGNNRNAKGNIVGKLGVMDLAQTATPVPVLGVTDATQVSCGHNIACALRQDGTVSCWGTDKHGNLGSGADGGKTANVPRSVFGVADVVHVAAGSGGACALRNDGLAFCWGRYRRGTLGSSTSGDGVAGPTQVNMSGIVALTAQDGGARHGPRCALNSSGNGYCWGGSANGQLGNGQTSNANNSTYNRYSPTAVSGLSGATAIAGYYTGACALLSDNTIRCWGRNEFGQVGDGSTSVRSTPVAVSGIDDATAIAAGGRGVCAIVTGGSVKCWGRYGIGQSSTPQTLRYF